MIWDDLYPVTKAEISLDNLRWNYAELNRLKSPKANFVAVVKADGYGHGSLEIAKVAIEQGATMLAVARLSEAIHLRKSGITVPILLFGYLHPDNIEVVHCYNLIATVNSIESAIQLSQRAAELDLSIKIHVKVDSGMGRLGFLVDDKRFLVDYQAGCTTCNQISEVCKMKNLIVEGIYTHFANADTFDKTHAYMQLELFEQLLSKLRKNGIDFKFIHAANSAGIIDIPESHYNLVRPGIAQYGLYPSDEIDRKKIELRPLMSITSTIIHVKTVPAGFKVSYGSTFETKKRTKIATVPVGYADGYMRLLSSKSFMIVGGVKVPVIGRVCMDLTMLDVSDVDNVCVGDEVIVLGEASTGVSVTADDLAAEIGTINYEIVSSMPSRIPRIYV
ncbi:MAG: alanine racemase [Spirochaetales bacterium]|nr:alanine racemase [Spirochaetales bacterium]